jgi:hypothetical protein
MLISYGLGVNFVTIQSINLSYFKIMNRRKFVSKTAAVAIGFGIPAFGMSRTTGSALTAEEEDLLFEFRHLLAGYPFSNGLNDQMATVQKVHTSASGVLDFQDASGQRISLRKVKGRLVARLH